MDFRGRWPGWVLLAPLALVGLLLVPVIKGGLLVCLFHKVTGWHCPGCGATRASEALLNFKVLEALQLNLVFSIALLFGIPFLVLSAARERFPKISWLQVFRWRLGFLWFALAVVVIFFIARNIPLFHWLAP